MLYDFGQSSPGPLSFWMETLSIFLGDVFASIFVGGSAYVIWWILKYPGFRVGANWTFVGWDVNKMGRLPNATDAGEMEFMPNVAVTSRDMGVKKIIFAVWVRERPDPTDPGEILGKHDLQAAGVPPEARTTGGDLLKFPGPRIRYPAAKFQRIMNFPIFVQTTDGEFFQAQSPGNQPKGIARLRFDVQDFVDGARRRIFSRLG
jgi:hypothetical protein